MPSIMGSLAPRSRPSLGCPRPTRSHAPSCCTTCRPSPTSPRPSAPPSDSPRAARVPSPCTPTPNVITPHPTPNPAQHTPDPTRVEIPLAAKNETTCQPPPYPRSLPGIA
eukprot:3941908-Rhodomonas_salina.1